MAKKKLKKSVKIKDKLNTAYEGMAQKSRESKPGLYANINAKQDRIKAGSGEKMNKVGSKGAPSKQDFINSAKTVKGY